jgi:hypothetical protein
MEWECLTMWKYKIGTVVREIDGGWVKSFGFRARPMFGHVVGFDQTPDEAILLVRWDDGSEQRIHPSNVLTEDEVE